MNLIKNNDGSQFYINKVFDNDFEFTKAHIEESLYGTPTCITFECHCDTKIIDLMGQYTGYLMSGNGIKWEFQCFCYELAYDNKLLKAKLMCCKPEFTRKKFTTKYTSIDNAIQSTWQLNRLDEVKSDILSLDSNHYFYQMNETNYHLCNKLCASYKHDTVYGFLLNGLRFIDLKSWKKGNIEFTDQYDIKLSNPSSWTSPKLYDENNEMIDYNSEVIEYEPDPNHVFVKNYESIIPVDRAYKDLIGNYLYNKRLNLIKQTGNFKVNNLPDYSVGDYAWINSKQIKFNKCFISKRIIDLRYSGIEVNITIQSIDPEV